MSFPPRYPPWPWPAMLLFAALPGWALKGLRPDGGLDRPAISKAYFEGESSTVINALEAYRNSAYHGTREDTLFVLKYLGVVYAADPATRAKADVCLRGLHRMEPSIDLADLYLPDSIQRIVAQAGKEAGTSGDLVVHPALEALGNTQGTPMPPTLLTRPVVDRVADTSGPLLGMPAPLPADTLAATVDGSHADSMPPAGDPAAPDSGGGAEVKRNRTWIWPVALGGAGVAAMTVLLLALDADAEDEKPRPVDVILEWPEEGRP